MTQFFGISEIRTDHTIQTRKADFVLIIIKKRTCKLEAFAVLGDHRLGIKNSEKLAKYQDHAGKL